METDRKDHTLNEWVAKIDEEEARWRHAGMSLDNLNLRGSEIFAMTCKIQAILNALVQEDTSEENLTLNLKMVIFSSMSDIREHLEPEIRKARLTQGVAPDPTIIMPWLKKDDNGG